MSDDTHLSPEDVQALRAMKMDAVPPALIEEAIVDRLRRDGLLPQKPQPTWRRLAAVAAALIIAFLAGLAVPREPREPHEPREPRFAILLYAGTQEAASHRAEYAAWARGVAATGTSISGEELADDGDEAGPRGYFVIAAPDAEAARHIAATCPHIRYGGRVVVRRIVS